MALSRRPHLVVSALASPLLVLSLTACETVRTAPARGGEDVATKAVMPIPADRSQSGSGAVMLVAEFKGLETDTPCRWRVINKTNNKSFFLPLNPSHPAVFQTLEPGTYKTGRLGCGVSRVWDLDEIFKNGFNVEDGRASYVGKLIFEFKGRQLDIVRKAPRDESARALAEAMQAMPDTRYEVISAFTGKSIQTEMATSTDLRDGFDVFATGVDDPSQQLAPLLTTLKTCAKEESANDPLRFGRLEYVAIYKQGRFNEMKKRDEANAFSDQLRSCVERGMMGFHPPVVKNDVEIRVRY